MKKLLSVTLTVILLISCIISVPFSTLSAAASAPESAYEWIPASPKAPVKSTMEQSDLLDKLMKKYTAFAVVRQRQLGGTHYAYTEAVSDTILKDGELYSPNKEEVSYRAGSEMVLVELEKSGNEVTKSETVLISDGNGVIRDPDVSEDGTRILFSWSSAKREDDYHLYEYNLMTDKYRQLTFGPGVADTEPKYLPNGNIIFSSTRMTQIVDCYIAPVSNLYLCGPDGENIVRVGYDQVHTTYPTVTDDGRVLYTRWDYNDRTQIYTQAIFQMFPDGTNQTEVYGNNTNFPPSLIHTRQVAGTSNRYISIAAGHHTYQAGKLCIIDTGKGRNASETQNDTLSFIVGENEQDELPYIYGAGDEYYDQYGQWGFVYKYPYSVTEDVFLVAGADIGYANGSGFESEKSSWGTSAGNWGNTTPFKIYIMNTQGKKVEFVGMSGSIGASQIVPIAKRTLFERPSMVNYGSDTGTYYIGNIYEGDGLKGVKPGTAKYLRIVALDYRPYSVGCIGSSDQSIDSTNTSQVFGPVSVGNGSWDVKQVLGIVDIYKDGSAMFKVPSETPVYFQVLDENYSMIQSMRSWSTLMPGETFSCVGCHEDKNTVPPAALTTTIAMSSGVQAIRPESWQDEAHNPYGDTQGFSYLKEIQPILDESCVKCHNDLDAAKKSAGIANMSNLVSPDTVKTDTSVSPEKSEFSLQGTRFGTVAAGSTNASQGAGVGKAFPISYLCLTGSLGGSFRNTKAETELINWINTMSDSEMRLPYSAGSSKSKLITMLLEKHGGVSLTESQIDAFRTWIDLGVPCMGDYSENNLWNSNQIRWAEESQNKRDYYNTMNRLARKARATGVSAAVPEIGITYTSGTDKYTDTYNFSGAVKMELPKAYKSGDNVKVILPEGKHYIGLTLNSRVGEAILYVPNGVYNFTIPENAAERYTPTFTDNVINTITVRLIDESELGKRHNLSKNPYDVNDSGTVSAFPHTFSNSSNDDMTDAPYNAIDGISANKGYGSYPSQSWGISGSGDMLQIDFKRKVNVDEIVIVNRHYEKTGHTYWRSGTLEFSDGSTMAVTFDDIADEQSFKTDTVKNTTYVRLTDLVKADSAASMVGVSELEVYGTETVAVPKKLNVSYKSGSNIYNDFTFTEDTAALTVPQKYLAGDTVSVTLPSGVYYLGLTLNEAMGEAILYVPNGVYTYTMPPAATMSNSYCPGFAVNTSNTVKARVVTNAEVMKRHNLAFNPYDLSDETSAYPHATASDSYNDSTFAPRNVIDGMADNDTHGSYPHQSWGPKADTNDKWLQINFGHEVYIDEVIMAIRADFAYAHDTYWKTGKLEFSDGSSTNITIDGVAQKQSFAFAAVKTSYVRLTDLVRSDQTIPWTGISEFEVYGTEMGSNAATEAPEPEEKQPDNLIEIADSVEVYRVRHTLDWTAELPVDYTGTSEFGPGGRNGATDGKFADASNEIQEKWAAALYDGDTETCPYKTAANYPYYHGIAGIDIPGGMSQESFGSSEQQSYLSEYRYGLMYDLGAICNLSSITLSWSSKDTRCSYYYSVYAGNVKDASILNKRVGASGCITANKGQSIQTNLSGNGRYLLVMFDLSYNDPGNANDASWIGDGKGTVAGNLWSSCNGDIAVTEIKLSGSKKVAVKKGFEDTVSVDDLSEDGIVSVTANIPDGYELAPKGLTYAFDGKSYPIVDRKYASNENGFIRENEDKYTVYTFCLPQSDSPVTVKAEFVKQGTANLAVLDVTHSNIPANGKVNLRFHSRVYNKYIDNSGTTYEIEEMGTILLKEGGAPSTVTNNIMSGNQPTKAQMNQIKEYLESENYNSALGRIVKTTQLYDRCNQYYEYVCQLCFAQDSSNLDVNYISIAYATYVSKDGKEKITLYSDALSCNYNAIKQECKG